MARKITLWDWRKGKEKWITTSYNKPAGFRTFTDVPKTAKELREWKKSYVVKIAKTPYGKNAPGGRGKVMFYRRKRR